MRGVAPVPPAALSSIVLLELPLRMHAVDALSSEPLNESGLTLAAPGFSLSFITFASRMTSRMKESLMAHLVHIHCIFIACSLHVHCVYAYSLHVHCVYHTIHCLWAGWRAS